MTMNKEDSSSQRRRYTSPPPPSMPDWQSYSPPPPASRCVAKVLNEIEPSPDSVWHEINTGHSILNPKILKAPILSNWGMLKSEYEETEDEDNEDPPELFSQSNSHLSLSLSNHGFAQSSSSDDINDGVDDDMPPLPSIKLSMRTERAPPLSPLVSMRVYGHCFIPIRHELYDAVDDVDRSENC